MSLFRITALAAGIGITLSMNAAHAAFVLELRSGGETALIKDNAAAGESTDRVDLGLTTAPDGDDTEGLIVYNAGIGGFTVTVTTGVSDPLIGPGRIDVNSLQVSGGSGTLEISLTDTDFTGVFSQYTTGFGGTTDGSVDFIFLYGNTNTELSGLVIDDYGGETGNFSGGSTVSTESPTSPYSLTIGADVTHTGPGQITSFDAVLTTVVPVPPAVWLFGSGLLGLVGIARRKKSA